MAANGISTMPKPDRQESKLTLAQATRQLVGTNGYRELNIFDLSLKAPTIGRPWKRA